MVNAVPDSTTGGGSGKWFEPYITCWGSDAPSYFPEALAKTIPIEPGVTKLLDIGCGSGIIGIYSLIEHKAHSVTFSDLLPKWIDVARCNVDIKVRAGAIQQAQVAYTSAIAFAELPPDLIAQQTLLVFNPPQLPEDFVDKRRLQEIEGDPTESVFRLSGPDGWKWPREFLKWYADLRMPKPDAVILLSSFLRQSRIEQEIASANLREVSRKATANIPLRAMFSRDKIAELSVVERKDRSLEPDGQGWWTKSLLTIRVRNQ